MAVVAIPQASSDASMLTEVSVVPPEKQELTEALDRLYKATNAVEYLYLSISSLFDARSELTEPLTAEQAWNLTYFARSCGDVATSLADWTRSIEREVESLYTEGEEERRAEAKR